MQRVRRMLPLAALMLVGCQNQPAAFTNPFMAPDRVPPPSTRALAPGTAQPYYPGDGAPAIGGTAPAYSPAPAVGTPVPANGPANGWNNYPSTAPATTPPYTPASPYGPTSSTHSLPAGGVTVADRGGYGSTGPGELVRVPDDDGGLRFAGNTLPPQPPASQSGLAGSNTPAYPPVTPTPQVAPVASLMPPPRSASDFQANAGVQAAVFQPEPQQVTLRAVQPSSFSDPQRLSAPDLLAASDGFRPQGSRRRTLLEEPTRPTLSPDQETLDRFGFDPQYQWLRGQLERDPDTGQWRVRYQRGDQQPDSLGGSVLIANPQLLGNLEPGALVVLRGQLHSLHFSDGRSAPAYQLAVVQRQLR